MNEPRGSTVYLVRYQRADWPKEQCEYYRRVSAARRLINKLLSDDQPGLALLTVCRLEKLGEPVVIEDHLGPEKRMERVEDLMARLEAFRALTETVPRRTVGAST